MWTTQLTQRLPARLQRRYRGTGLFDRARRPGEIFIATCSSCHACFWSTHVDRSSGVAFCVDCLDRARPGVFAEFYDELGGGD